MSAKQGYEGADRYLESCRERASAAAASRDALAKQLQLAEETAAAREAEVRKAEALRKHYFQALQTQVEASEACPAPFVRRASRCWCSGAPLVLGLAMPGTPCVVGGAVGEGRVGVCVCAREGEAPTP